MHVTPKVIWVSLVCRSDHVPVLQLAVGSARHGTDCKCVWLSEPFDSSAFPFIHAFVFARFLVFHNVAFKRVVVVQKVVTSASTRSKVSEEVGDVLVGRAAGWHLWRVGMCHVRQFQLL